MAMKLRIYGIANLFSGINGGLQDMQTELDEKYQAAIEECTARFASSAKSNLGKPSWMLSAAIEEKTKIYKEGRFHFGVAEIMGQRDAEPNTPGKYAWFQEHGYHVALKTVPVNKRRDHKIVKTLYKKWRGKPVYRHQEPKRFFEAAFNQHQRTFEAMIHKIHRELSIPIKREVGKNYRDPHK